MSFPRGGKWGYAPPAELDLGFDHAVLAEMFATLSRGTDAELPVPDAERKTMRDFFADWGRQLRGD